MEILIIGAGFVGVTTAVTFAEFGHTVTCIDIDREKIKALQDGKLYFYEPDLEEILTKHVMNSNIQFCSQSQEAIERSRTIFICVGTPSLKSGGADVKHVMRVANMIGQFMNGYKLIAIKSTVPVGTCEKVKECIGRIARTSTFDVVSNPEFLREGSALADSLHPHRVVIGSTNPVATAEFKELYNPLTCPVIATNPQTAELIKYASNSFLATKISYMNQLARLCDAFHVNIRDVAYGMGLDPRISKQFLDAGVGYGGSCFPKDVRALLAMADDCGVGLSILEQVQHVNETQHSYFLAKIHRQLGSLNGKMVAVFGLAFKPNTSDTRESPTLSIIQHLVDHGSTIKVHDPVAKLPSWLERLGVQQCESPEEAAVQADAIVICTDWPQYKESVDWYKVKSNMRNAYVFDGRNMLSVEIMRSMGFSYEGIGYS